MQKQTSLYIPKPCHADWNKMTPTQQGKFCGTCNKQVVDFSLMSDNQILNFLSNQSGKLCGRFDAEQLQRPLVETKIKKKKSWWMALTLPLLFLFDRSNAQNRKVVGDTTYTVPSKQEIKQILIGKVAVPRPQQSNSSLTGVISTGYLNLVVIKGKVLDENNEVVPFATIKQKETENAVVADADGNFSIIIEKSNTDIILTSSAIGLETTDQKINFSQDSIIIVMMRMIRELTGDVVVIAGGISSCQRVKTIDTFHATAKKLLGIAMFKIYPNPIVNNSIIHIQIKNTGSYQMQLLNNQSALMQTEEINVDMKNATTQIQLPSNIAAGIYYLRLINEQTKKSYTEKLIIQ
ncbi:MAG: carboxypeptidase-like regulatory domain-containing protein [Parafilimonas sp.]